MHTLLKLIQKYFYGYFKPFGFYKIVEDGGGYCS